MLKQRGNTQNTEGEANDIYTDTKNTQPNVK